MPARSSCFLPTIKGFVRTNTYMETTSHPLLTAFLHVFNTLSPGNTQNVADVRDYGPAIRDTLIFMYVIIHSVIYALLSG